MKVCELVGAKYLSVKDACAKVGVSFASLSRLTSGEEPKKPGWADQLSRARASAVENWIGLLKLYSDRGNSAGVRAAEKMLQALDSARFRDTTKQAQAAVIVEIVQGSGERNLPVVAVRAKEITDGEERSDC